jgi:hypothetical protein
MNEGPDDKDPINYVERLSKIQPDNRGDNKTKSVFWGTIASVECQTLSFWNDDNDDDGEQQGGSGGTRTRLNKSIATSTIPRTAVTVMTQAARTRVHNLQSDGSFVSDVLAVLRRL